MKAPNVSERTCSIEGCDREKWARGWCSTHYQRWRTAGDPQPDVPIAAPLSRRERLDRYIVRQPGCWDWRGTVSAATGYGLIGNCGVHRIMWEEVNGPIPEGMVLDHSCHNEAARRGECAGGPSCLHRRCVNPEHLRLVTHAENLSASPLTANGRGPTPCAAAECHLRRERATGYCGKHHRRLEQYGDAGVVPERLSRPAVCSAEGCDRPHHASGYCGAHAMRVRKHGDPLVHLPLQSDPHRTPLGAA